MVSQAGTSLREGLEARLAELGEALDGIGEEQAGQRPGDAEWCCKEILSHLTGDDGAGFLDGLRRFLDEDTPLIGVVQGLPYYSPARQAMSLSELRAGVWRQYQGIAEFVGGLSEEELSRKARIPLLKDNADRRGGDAGAVGGRDREPPPAGPHRAGAGAAREARRLAMRIPAPIHRFVLKQFVGQTKAYFNAPQFRGWEVEQVSERVYTFRWHWYRNVFVVTDEGIVATDPFNPEAAALLRQAIRDKTGDRPVRQLFYTHYHRDHTEGGAALEAQEVVAYEGCTPYFDDMSSPDIVRPTRTITGDQTVDIGGVRFELLYLGKTHTDTLYAVHVPAEGVLFTADFGMVRAFPPVGYPDFYRAGVMRAAERLSRLDFESFVPSHFGHGTKRDFLDFWEMFRKLDELSSEGNARFGRPDERPVEAFAHVYDRLRGDYGDWHGFDQMILFSVVRTATGQLLGY